MSALRYQAAHQRSFASDLAVAGLGGLEPPASSLSEFDGWALCYRAFPQLALIHEWHRDGVNHAHPRQVAVAVSWRVPWAPGGLELRALSLDSTGQLAKQVPVMIAGTGATPEIARQTQTRVLEQDPVSAAAIIDRDHSTPR